MTCSPGDCVARNEHSISAHFAADFEEAPFQEWAESLRQKLGQPQVSLGLVFMTPRFFARARQILEILRVHAHIPLLAGCSSQSLIAGGREFEENAGLVLGLYTLPGGELKATHFTQEDVEAATSPEYWWQQTGVTPDRSNGWLVFIDPFHLDSEAWIKSWNDSFSPLPVLGGLASGDFKRNGPKFS